MAAKTYTLEDVKQHNTPDNLWIIIEGKVYDVTKFRNEVNEKLTGFIFTVISCKISNEY